ncbi:MAG: sulfite exporter TauE/SafE family protein [Phycisphaerales bacterium]|nr:sulfite exporter TauE/SafE family protein [Phycisphaerales bacterium]
MIEYGAVFAGSLLGSAHCVGMCGGLAVTIGATHRSFWPTFARQLVYTAGRVFTYSFLGAVGGFAGLSLSQYQMPLIGAQQVFSFAAGLIMLLVGLSTLGWLPFKSKRPVGTAGRLCATIFNHFLNGRGWFGYFAAGLATGFLPCGLVYAFLAMAVAGSNVGQGMLLMACFGLGTAPAMLLVGCGSSLLSHQKRAQVFRVAAVFLIIMGGVMIYRAIPKKNGTCCAGAFQNSPKTMLGQHG